MTSALWNMTSALWDMTSALWDMTSDKPGLREAESSAQSKAVTDRQIVFCCIAFCSELCSRRSKVKLLQIHPFCSSGTGDIH